MGAGRVMLADTRPSVMRPSADAGPRLGRMAKLVASRRAEIGAWVTKVRPGEGVRD